MEAPTLTMLREAAGLKQSQLARLAGCDPALVCRYEERTFLRVNGLRGHRLFRLAEVLAEHLSWASVLPWLLSMKLPIVDAYPLELDWEAGHPVLRAALQALAKRPEQQRRIALVIQQELGKLRPEINAPAHDSQRPAA